ncbi:hypothetical protein [Sphingomonas sp. PR090111-T3T-6A]|uniref:hypothetical protein n=1 Tax=Sphingomonas sp. PR090111-T3T-6A TaxID=685778 RepID=UPI00038238DF|nr:hypothetical protein [Sphingomonas sp. PR090111-T3T-6A]
MRRAIAILCLSFAGVATAHAAVSESGAMPSFRDIELRYTGEDVLQVGRDAVARAIPIGTSAATAQAVLDRAGARCKPTRRDPQIIRCVHDDVTTVDEAVDDIHWKTMLHVVDDKVASLSVDREVDRHGTQD